MKTKELSWTETKVKSFSCVWLLQLKSPCNSPGQNTGLGSNPGLPHCRWILYQLSHQGSPRILEWVPYPFSSASSQHRNQTGVSCIAGGFCTSWAAREALQEFRYQPELGGISTPAGLPAGNPPWPILSYQAPNFSVSLSLKNKF